MRHGSWMAQALEMAWVVALSTLIPLGIGLGLDYRLGTAPWVTLGGMVVGVVVSTANVLRQMNATFRALDEECAERKASQPLLPTTELPDDEKEETD